MFCESDTSSSDENQLGKSNDSWSRSDNDVIPELSSADSDVAVDDMHSPEVETTNNMLFPEADAEDDMHTPETEANVHTSETEDKDDMHTPHTEAEDESYSPEVISADNVPSLDRDATKEGSSIPVLAADSSNEMKEVYGPDRKPKPNSYIMFKEFGEKWLQARVLSIQPKRKGANRDWVNMEIQDRDEPCSKNWDWVEKWKLIEAPEHPVFLTASQELSQEVVNAKEK